MASQPPLLAYDNLLDTIMLYPGAVLTTSSEQAGHEARRVADGRRERTDWMPTGAGTDPTGNWVMVDLGSGNTAAPNCLWLDRGHNLGGHQLVVEGLTSGTVQFSSTHTVPAAGVVGGTPTAGTLVGTLEGSAWGFVASAPAKQQWRMRIPFASGFIPRIPGLLLGTRSQFLEYSATIDDDARSRKMASAESDAGYQASAPVYTWRTAELDMRLIGDTEYDGMVTTLADALFNRGVPTLLCHDYAQHPERTWLFALDGTTWAAAKTRTRRDVRLRLRELGAQVVR